jgi:hypothetical protein
MSILPLKAFDITLLNHRGGMDREVFWEEFLIGFV